MCTSPSIKHTHWVANTNEKNSLVLCHCQYESEVWKTNIEYQHIKFELKYIFTNITNSSMLSVLTAKYTTRDNTALNRYTFEYKTHFCLRLFGGRGGSFAGFSKMSRKIGWNFLNVTIDTAKLRSSRSILSRNSWGKLAMSAHFFIFLKNSIRLIHHKKLITPSLSQTKVGKYPVVTHQLIYFVFNHTIQKQFEVTFPSGYKFLYRLIDKLKHAT